MIHWPAKPIVARAYLDQLGRSEAIPVAKVSAVTEALDLADEALAGGTMDDETASRLDSLATKLEGDISVATGRDQMRLQSLAETVRGVADSLR